MNRFALRADLLDFVADPGWDTPGDATPGLRWRPDHWLLVDGACIAGVLDAAHAAPPAGFEVIDARGLLLLPGFVDAHVHSPQLDVIASYGTELLDWLQTYTFPAERRHADPVVARAGAERFCDALLAHGTTSAAVFPTVHRQSVDALFGSARARGMRLVAGKCLMDRHVPAGLADTVAEAERDSLELIARWHGRDRLAYAMTVRFAPTSSPAQMDLAGRLLREVPGLYLQTHLAENRAELRWVAELFPQARSYLDVYHRHGLLGARSLLAHGIWLDDADRALLGASGATIAHCPTSNLFLGSGLLDWRALERAGARVAMATDVGGGTSLSMLRTLAEAYKVQALQGVRLSAWKALHSATAGAAEALGLAHEIGRLEPGLHADLCLWDWSRGVLDAHRLGLARGLHERVFAWITLADERHLSRVWVAGVERYRRDRDENGAPWPR